MCDSWESGVGEIWPQAVGIQQMAVGPSAEGLETICTEQNRQNAIMKKPFYITKIKQRFPERMWFRKNIIRLMEKIYTPAQVCIHIHEHMLNLLNTVQLVYSSFALLHVQMEKIWHLIINQQATESDETSKVF